MTACQYPRSTFFSLKTIAITPVNIRLNTCRLFLRGTRRSLFAQSTTKPVSKQLSRCLLFLPGTRRSPADGARGDAAGRERPGQILPDPGGAGRRRRQHPARAGTVARSYRAHAGRDGRRNPGGRPHGRGRPAAAAARPAAHDLAGRYLVRRVSAGCRGAGPGV